MSEHRRALFILLLCVALLALLLLFGREVRRELPMPTTRVITTSDGERLELVEFPGGPRCVTFSRGGMDCRW